MTMWIDAYTAYLEHCGYYTPNEITSAVETLKDLIDRFPPRLKETIEKELNRWSRDDFVDIGGFETALIVLQPIITSS